MAPDTDPPIFLVGFMGSGKSTVGRIVATRTGRPFVDTDELVVEREGRSIETIFRESGEGHFRRVEWEALQAIDVRDRAVVATGGGLFLGALQRRWLKRRGVTVWLDATLADCLRRIGGGTSRPLWQPDRDPVGFRALFERRRAVYALAQIRVAASGTPAEVARGLLGRLRAPIP